jgi:hypothetical protein
MVYWSDSTKQGILQVNKFQGKDSIHKLFIDQVATLVIVEKQNKQMSIIRRFSSELVGILADEVQIVTGIID